MPKKLALFIRLSLELIEKGYLFVNWIITTDFK